MKVRLLSISKRLPKILSKKILSLLNKENMILAKGKIVVCRRIWNRVGREGRNIISICKSRRRLRDRIRMS